jgi:hypothetical protein
VTVWAPAVETAAKVTAIEIIAFHMEYPSHQIQQAKINLVQEAKVLTEFETTQPKDVVCGTFINQVGPVRPRPAEAVSH